MAHHHDLKMFHFLPYSGELLPISSSQRESHLHRQLKLIEENQSLVDRCLYLPSNPHLKIIGMFGNEAKLMQSAAKVNLDKSVFFFFVYNLFLFSITTKSPVRFSFFLCHFC